MRTTLQHEASGKQQEVQSYSNKFKVECRGFHRGQATDVLCVGAGKKWRY
jgi:hypothetical protein